MNQKALHPLILSRLRQSTDRIENKRAVAEAADISYFQLYRYFNGTSDITLSKLLRLTNAIGVDIGWIMTGRSYQEDKP